MRTSSTPNWRTASTTAFTTAGVDAMAPASPTPLTPNGLLVEGVSVANDATGRKLKFLRRIPLDPLTSSADWGLRAYGDKPDSSSWGGGNVYDVYSKADGTGLDGTKYRDW